MTNYEVKEGVADSWQEDEVWRMELYLSTGIMALCLLSLLAIASLPSVADALNWREFTFVQAYAARPPYGLPYCIVVHLFSPADNHINTLINTVQN
ncbi:unnamed protein product [Gadus morhua 'NCC']